MLGIPVTWNTTVDLITWMLDTSHLQVNSLGRGQNAWRAIMAQRKAFTCFNSSHVQFFSRDGITEGNNMIYVNSSRVL